MKRWAAVAAAAFVAQGALACASDSTSAIRVQSELTSPAPAVEVLVDGQNSADLLVIDNNRIYWVNNAPGLINGPQYLMTMALPGCTDCPTGPQVLAQPYHTTALVASGDDVFYSQGLEIYDDPDQGKAALVHIDRVTGTATTLVKEAARSLVVSGGYLYWLANVMVLTVPDQQWELQGSIRREPLTRLTPYPSTLVSALEPSLGLAVDDERLYWIQYTGSIHRRTFFGSSDELIAPEPTDPYALPADLVRNAQNLYWYTIGKTGTVVGSSLTGDRQSPLATGQDWPSGIVTDGASMYWTTSGHGAVPGSAGAPGTLMKAPLSGGAATTLVTATDDPIHVQPSHTHVVLDHDYVYWAAGDKILRTAK